MLIFYNIIEYDITLVIEGLISRQCIGNLNSHKSVGICNVIHVWLYDPIVGELGENMLAEMDTVATSPLSCCSIHVLIWANEAAVASMNE